MQTIQIGFKAFDPHELLVHFLAEDAGLYKAQGIQVELVDITFVNDNEIPSGLFQVSCGAALSGALQGNGQCIVFVATDKPMFWIYGNNTIDELADLNGSRLATFPVIAPPHHLANMVLGKNGLDVTSNLTLRAARDDIARLGLLQSASVEAAVISSSIAPPEIVKRGFKQLAFIGDHISIPTTGLAIDEDYLEKQGALVETISTILNSALALLHQEPTRVASVLEKVFHVSPESCEETVKIYQSCYTENGRIDEALAQQAITSLGKALAIDDTPGWQTIYRF